jgi:DNA-binding Lrp family transcriptional regulator
MKAYILITTQIGKADDVYASLAEMDGVSAVDIVTGTYDLVAVVEARDARSLGRIVMEQVQRTRGVMSTVTLIAII